MKKLLFILLGAIFAGWCLAGCGRGCDDCGELPKEKMLVWKFYVRNLSDKIVIISNNYEYGPYSNLIALAPHKSEIIYSTIRGYGILTAEDEMEDFLQDSDTIDMGEGYPFIMTTVDGKVVPDEIWLRKNWSFFSNKYIPQTDPYRYCSYYSLEITNNLLDHLSSLNP